MAGQIILFDLDGTIWDSIAWYSDVLAAESIISREEILADLKSGTNVVRVAKWVGVNDRCFDRACRNGSMGPPLYPNVRSTLATLSDRGIQMGLVTNLPARIAQPLIRATGIDQAFSTIQFAASKPSPRGLLAAIQELGAGASKEVLYIGDTLTDSNAASRTGVSFVLASYGYGEIFDHAELASIRGFDEVLDL